MFTGIITNIGQLAKKEGSLFIFKTDKAFCQKIKKGTSIAVNGACLTSLDTAKATSFTVEVMPETLKKTMLVDLKPNDSVNLELPATPSTLLSGHIVQGHIDETGIIQNIKEKGNSKIITVTITHALSKYLVTKGSVAINGISLTIIEAKETYFTVGIIPYTWRHTMLYSIKTGDRVNIETDILAKYLEKILGKEDKE